MRVIAGDVSDYILFQSVMMQTEKENLQLVTIFRWIWTGPIRRKGVS